MPDPKVPLAAECRRHPCSQCQAEENSKDTDGWSLVVGGVLLPAAMVFLGLLFIGLGQNANKDLLGYAIGGPIISFAILAAPTMVTIGIVMIKERQAELRQRRQNQAANPDPNHYA